MPVISLRSLLAKLAAIALATSSAPALADDTDSDDDLDASLDLDTTNTDDAPQALGRGLAMALSKMRPIDALHVASTWGLADNPIRRLAVATALEWVFPLVGDGVVIDHLSRDRDPKIRLAAARAAWARRTTGGDPGVLRRLAEDPDEDIRELVLTVTRGRDA